MSLRTLSLLVSTARAALVGNAVPFRAALHVQTAFLRTRAVSLQYSHGFADRHAAGSAPNLDGMSQMRADSLLVSCDATTRRCSARPHFRGMASKTRARFSKPTMQQVECPSEEAATGSAADMPTQYSPSSVEQRLYQWWESSGYFKPAGDESKQCFVISMPPPNVTGKLHMGHAMFVALEDIMARFHRMRGHPTLWLPGTDHAGIATQMLVERALKAEGQSRVELGRDAFLKRVWEWKEEYGGAITGQIRRLGASCDWSREKFTLQPELVTAVNEAFVRLHEKGLVYRGEYMVNWSPALGTAVRGYRTQ